MLKNRLHLLLIVLIAYLPLTFAWPEEEKKEEKSQTQTAETEIPVNYEVIQQGTYSGLREQLTQTVTDTKSWEAVWKKHVSMLVPQPPVPEIDFNTNSAVVIATGEKKTSGYTILVTGLALEANDIVLKYRITEPQPNSFTLQVLTQPFLMLKIQKPKGIIKLLKE